MGKKRTPPQRERDSLVHAVNMGDVDKVRSLLEVEDSPVQRDEALSFAALFGQVEMVRILLAAGAAPSSKNHIAYPLQWAADGGDLEVARILLEAGADVNACNPFDGTSAIHWAALSARPEMVRILLEAGAEPSARAKVDGSTPLHWVTSRVGASDEHTAGQTVKTVLALLEAGADATMKEDRGYSSLDWIDIQGGDWPQKEPEVVAMAVALLRAGAPAPQAPYPWVATAIDVLAAERRLARGGSARQRKRA